VDGGPFSSQTQAVEAAQAKYPDAQAVINITAKGRNKTFSQKLDLGYYAIKFTGATDNGVLSK
jgi:hypothetical protein